MHGENVIGVILLTGVYMIASFIVSTWGHNLDWSPETMRVRRVGGLMLKVGIVGIWIAVMLTGLWLITL